MTVYHLMAMGLKKYGVNHIYEQVQSVQSWPGLGMGISLGEWVAEVAFKKPFL